MLNSRYLLYEAQQANFYGLNSTKALESVTTTPAKAAGLGHRLGYVSEGSSASSPRCLLSDQIHGAGYDAGIPYFPFKILPTLTKIYGRYRRLGLSSIDSRSDATACIYRWDPAD